MRRIAILLATLLLMGSSLACCCSTFPRNIQINTGPTIEVGLSEIEYLCEIIRQYSNV